MQKLKQKLKNSLNEVKKLNSFLVVKKLILGFSKVKKVLEEKKTARKINDNTKPEV